MNRSFCVHSSGVHRARRHGKRFVLLAFREQKAPNFADHDFANGRKEKRGDLAIAALSEIRRA
jgi:hypothetical protein